MPTIPAPPPFPWIAYPESAFKPLRAWLPTDYGNSIREYIAGDHAAITGTAAWGMGAFGRCLIGNGSTYALSGPVSGLDSFTITIAHLASPTAVDYRALAGWGLTNQGILYSPSSLALIDAATSARFSAPLLKPQSAWRVISLTLAGHASGSAAEFWADGVRVASGTLGASLTAPSQFWIGSLRNGPNPWQGNIGQVYVHVGVLGGREIREIHADLHRVLRNEGNGIPLMVAALPPPFIFSGVGESGSPSASGSLGLSWPLSGAGQSGTPSGAGALAYGWEIGGTGLSGAPSATGEIESGWIISGTGHSGAPSASGVLDWPWTFGGIGLSGPPEGSGRLVWKFSGADPLRASIARKGAEPGRAKIRRK